MSAKGFSLLEVLISSFILSIGILSVVGLQSVALKSVVQVQQSTLADSLLVDITQRMQLNQSWLATGGNHYNTESLIREDISLPDCASGSDKYSNCSGLQIKQNDLFELKQKLLSTHVSGNVENGLIDGDACIEFDANGIVTVVLS